MANALAMNGSDLRGRQIKVSAKRTNVPGLKIRGRGGRGRGGRGAPGMPFDPYGMASMMPMMMNPMMMAMMGGGGRGFGSPYGRGCAWLRRALPPVAPVPFLPPFPAW